MIYTGSKSLQYLRIPVYTIFKNLTIILIAYGEVIWFGGSVTRMMLISFGLMASIHSEQTLARQADHKYQNRSFLHWLLAGQMYRKPFQRSCNWIRRLSDTFGWLPTAFHPQHLSYTCASVSNSPTLKTLTLYFTTICCPFHCLSSHRSFLKIGAQKTWLELCKCVEKMGEKMQTNNLSFCQPRGD